VAEKQKKIDDDKHTTGKTDKKSYYTAAPTLSSINNKVFLIEFLIFSIFFSDLTRSHPCLVTWEVASKYMFGIVSTYVETKGGIVKPW